MAHFSGNPTWVDWPQTTTQMTSARMENLELAVDALRDTPIVSAHLGTAIAGITGNAYFGLRTNMTVDLDPFTMWSGAGGANLYQVSVPSFWGGRYHIYWSTWITGQAGGTSTLAMLLRNCPFTTIDANLVSYQVDRAQSFGTPTTLNATLPLIAGETLSFAAYIFQAGTFGMAATVAGAPLVQTRIVVRWVGPT